MPRNGSPSDVGAWAARWWRALLAETVATALLVLLGVASLLPHVAPGGGGAVEGAPLTHPALAFAFLVTGLAVAFGGASGAHMNPAVTVAALLAGRLPRAAAAGYVAAQLAGGAAGFAALAALAPSEALADAAGCTAPAPGVSPPAAAALEALLTGTLALACCAVWADHDPARPDRAAPLKLGLTVGGLVYAGGLMSGASLNPARSFGPALWHNAWAHHWVYWAGPLGGAALGALLHRFVLAAPVSLSAPAPRPEELPLHDKPDR